VKRKRANNPRSILSGNNEMSIPDSWSCKTKGATIHCGVYLRNLLEDVELRSAECPLSTLDCVNERGGELQWLHDNIHVSLWFYIGYTTF